MRIMKSNRLYRVYVFITVLCGQFKLNYNPVLDFVRILDFLVLLSDSSVLVLLLCSAF